MNYPAASGRGIEKHNHRPIVNKKTLLNHIAIFILGTSVILFNAPSSFAFELYNEGLDSRIHGSVVLSASVGYRMDNLNWNIAGNQYGGNPNVLSELEFNDIQIYQAGLGLKATLNRIYSRASISFGEIRDGECTDSDYDEDNRTQLWSRSKSQINNDDILDISAGLGFQFDLIGEKLKISPLIGLSYHQQNIRMTDLAQTVATAGRTPGVGPISGLNSTYRTEWKSLWIGADISFEVMTRLLLSSSLEYHTAYYEAKADWNLREDFQHPVSFTHEADGKGLVIKIGINHFFAEHWDIGLTYSWQKWSTDPGYDRVFFATGQTSTQRLNEVNWDSQSVNLSLSYKF